MKKLFFALFLFIGIAGTVDAQVVYLNNSAMHVFEGDDNIGLNLLAHELLYVEQINDGGLFWGASVELDHGAVLTESTYQLFLNPMIGYQGTWGRVLPYISGSFSYVTFLELDESGFGPSVTAGFLMPVSDNSAFFLQGRLYNYDTDYIDLGNFLVQFGHSFGL